MRSTATEAGCARDEIGAPLIEVQSAAGFYLLQASLTWTGCASAEATRLWQLGLSAVIEEVSGTISYWALDASAGTRGFPSFRLLCARACPSVANHEIRHRPAHRRTKIARAAQGPPRRAACASGLRHARPDAFARCAGRVQRREAHRRVRPAARAARRQAGQHDRIAGLPRSGPWHPGLQPLWRGAQTDRCVDGHIRRDARRSAGSGLPHLHVHHHAAQLPGDGGEAQEVGVGARSPKPRRPARSKASRCAPAGRALSARDRCRCGTG